MLELRVKKGLENARWLFRSEDFYYNVLYKGTADLAIVLRVITTEMFNDTAFLDPRFHIDLYKGQWCNKSLLDTTHVYWWRGPDGVRV